MPYRKLFAAAVVMAAFITTTPRAQAQSYLCEDEFKLDDAAMDCYREGPEAPPPPAFKAYHPPAPESPFMARLRRYTQLGSRHKISGLASYYSTSLDGSLTATGEIYRNQRLSAAHLTLPLGCWIEVTARATGRKIRLRVNDRGPYVRKFVLDLSQAAARILGVDVAADRRVDIRVIAMPGEEPLPEDLDINPSAVDEETTLASTEQR
jgi:rare lipoprotein A